MKIPRGWLIPLFIIITGFAVYLLLYALPSEVFGSEWTTIKLDFIMFIPWLCALALAFYTLKKVLE